jgi:hypothetical protein
VRDVRHALPVQGPADLRSFLIAALLAGCGAKEDPSFTNVRDEVLLPSCGFSTCHGSGTGGLSLDEAGAYDALVDVDSSGSPGNTLVIPGDPDNSYLVRKLEGGPDIVGDQMPPGGELDADRLQLLRDWIEAGAPND